jgi:hypothetical protein
MTSIHDTSGSLHNVSLFFCQTEGAHRPIAITEQDVLLKAGKNHQGEDHMVACGERIQIRLRRADVETYPFSAAADTFPAGRVAGQTCREKGQAGE